MLGKRPRMFIKRVVERIIDGLLSRKREREASCGISFSGRLAAILQIDQGHDDACPDAFVVWLLLRLAQEFEQVCSQRDQLRLRQTDGGPSERDLPSFPYFLGHTRSGNVGLCGLQRGTKEKTKRSKFEIC